MTELLTAFETMTTIQAVRTGELSLLDWASLSVVTSRPVASIRRAGDVGRAIEAFSTLGNDFTTDLCVCAKRKATSSWNACGTMTTIPAWRTGELWLLNWTGLSVITNGPIASIRRAGDILGAIEAFSTVGKDLRTNFCVCATRKATSSRNAFLVGIY